MYESYGLNNMACQEAVQFSVGYICVCVLSSNQFLTHNAVLVTPSSAKFDEPSTG